MTLLIINYWVNILVEMAIRSPLRKTWKGAAKKSVSRVEKSLMGMLWVMMIVFLLVFTRAHADLKSNGSPTLEVFEGHTLVPHGLYGSLRQSMDSTGLLFLIPFYIIRVRAEKKRMIDTFGNPYCEYMQKTGRWFQNSMDGSRPRSIG